MGNTLHIECEYTFCDCCGQKTHIEDIDSFHSITYDIIYSVCPDCSPDVRYWIKHNLI